MLGCAMRHNCAGAATAAARPRHDDILVADDPLLLAAVRALDRPAVQRFLCHNSAAYRTSEGVGATDAVRTLPNSVEDPPRCPTDLAFAPHVAGGAGGGGVCWGQGLSNPLSLLVALAMGESDEWGHIRSVRVAPVIPPSVVVAVVGIAADLVASGCSVLSAFAGLCGGGFYRRGVQWTALGEVLLEALLPLLWPHYLREAVSAPPLLPPLYGREGAGRRVAPSSPPPSSHTSSSRGQKKHVPTSSVGEGGGGGAAAACSPLPNEGELMLRCIDSHNVGAVRYLLSEGVAATGAILQHALTAAEPFGDGGSGGDDHLSSSAASRTRRMVQLLLAAGADTDGVFQLSRAQARAKPTRAQKMLAKCSV